MGPIQILSAFLCALLSAGAIINPSGDTIKTRFNPPDGYVRPEYDTGSFARYLSHLPLKPAGSPVLLYDGTVKRNRVHEAVIDMPILDKNLVQCADAIIKLRAEYLCRKQDYDRINFHIASGMAVPFSKYLGGYRVRVHGNKTYWVRAGKAKPRREIFEEYLEFLYVYAGTASLSGDMIKTGIGTIKAGDVFIMGGSPGHAVLVVDLAANAATGEKVMILAQSYMPSQEMHVLKSGTDISPWYKVEEGRLSTPEWTFPKGSLKRFAD